MTALFQTEEEESYFWSSLNQKLWLFTKASPQDIRTVFGNICDKKNQTIKMNWDHLVIGQRWLPAAVCIFVKSQCFCISHLLLQEIVHKISNCQANHSQEEDPLFGIDHPPLIFSFTDAMWGKVICTEWIKSSLKKIKAHHHWNRVIWWTQRRFYNALVSI